MKKVILFCIILFSVVLLTGCGNKKSDYKLQIKESSWSGWSEDYKPEEKTNEYEIELGKEYVIGGGTLTFKIEKINKNSIEIVTTNPFSSGEGGIDLSTKETKFIVSKDEELKLTTPSMDEGEIYYLKLIK